MNTPILVRDATADDATHIAGILKVMATQAYPGKLPPNALKALSSWLTNDTPHRRLVADSGSGVIGHIQINATPNTPTPTELGDALEIARLFVHPQHRNKGVASALLTAAEETLREQGRAGYLAIPEHQKAAHHLVGKHQWRPIGTHSGPDGPMTTYRSPK